MADKPIIRCFDTKPYDIEFFERANASYGFGIHFHKDRLGPETVDLARDADAVCVFVNDELSADVARQLEAMHVRLVALRCAGYNNVDLSAFFGHIPVTRVPAYSPHAVAEFTVAMLLSLNRKLHRAYSRTRDGNFQLSGLLGFDLYNKTAGVVGTGRIGRITAQILRGFEMRVLAYDVRPDNSWAASSGVEYCELDRLFAESHVVSLNCPLTPETTHMIDEAAIGTMRDGALIVNTGRGGLIDTPALIEALKSGKIAGAALDVYEEEDEYFFEDFSDRIITDDQLARLLSLPNVLVTSHQAFFTEEALTQIAETTLASVDDFFTHGNLPNEICYRCGVSPCPRKEKNLKRCFEVG